MSSEIDLGRRSLFKGQYKPTASMLLPPWSVAQANFLELCTRCSDCVTECPENILMAGSGGFPTTNFQHNECTFCGDCVSACPSGALSSENTPWQQAPIISEQCLAQKGVVCRSCSDACDPEAIIFNWTNQAETNNSTQTNSHTPGIRGVATPSVNNDLCNGCGACISICPSDALTMQPLTHSNTRKVG